MTVRILHAADLHLGRAFPHLGEVGETREQDLFKTFERICAEALAREVAALMFAGDVFDTFDPPSEIVDRVRESLQRVINAGIAVFIVPGESDSASYERSVWRRETFDGVQVFLSPVFERRSIDVAETAVHVHGIAFDPVTNPQPLGTLNVAGSGIHIALLHATVDGPGVLVGAHHYFPVDSAELLTSGVSYAALGHGHRQQRIVRKGAVACNPGTPEGLERDEEGPRFAALVEFDGGPPEVSFVEVGQRRIENVAVDATDSNAGDVLDALLDRAGEDVLLSAAVTGTPLELVDVHALTRALADRFFWIDIRDETTLSTSAIARAIAAENTVRGHFVATLLRRLGSTNDVEERARLEEALKLGLRSFERSSAA